MKSIFKEPLVHFLIGAVVVFAFFEITGTEQTTSEDTISVDQAQIDRMIGRWQGTWRRVPNPQERQGLIENLVRDEVLYREGLRLGLDQNDAVVRNRMIQKMRFLQDEALQDPTDQDLQTWLDTDLKKYQKSDLYTFEHRFYGQKADPQVVAAQLQALKSNGDLEDTTEPLFNLPKSMQSASRAMIIQQFGEEFANQVSQLETNSWHGPVRSGFGVHLVRVNNIEQAPKPELSEPSIRQRVENDWRTAQRKQSQQRQYETLRQRYKIDVAK